MPDGKFFNSVLLSRGIIRFFDRSGCTIAARKALSACHPFNQFTNQLLLRVSTGFFVIS